MNRHLLVALSILMLFLVPKGTFACSCVNTNLEWRFEQSTNVFTALVTSGKYDEDRNVVTEFHVTEVFKGSIPFDRIRTSGAGTSCAMSIAVGYEYLFFMGDSGQIGFCSGHGPVGESGSDNMQRYLEILQAYKAGTVPDLSEPWHFSSNDGLCVLTTNFLATDERFVSPIWFFYRYAPPEIDHGFHWPKSELGVPGLEIILLGWEKAVSTPLTVRTANQDLKANWVAADRNFSHKGSFRLEGEDALLIAADLSNTKAISIAGKLPSHGPIEAQIRTTSAGTAIDEFFGCISNRGE